MRCLIRPFECTGEVSASLYSYSRIYAAQIVLVTLLSAVTIFRREMSCNRVYQDDDGGSAVDGSSSNSNRRETKEGAEWDDLLEGAGKWGSGKPLTGIILSVWSTLIEFKERIEQRNCGFNSSTTAAWTEEMSDELLEGAGLSLSGEPFWSAVLALWTRIWMTSIEEHRVLISKPSPLTQRLSPDVQVHILSYLDPRDITTFACCNKDCNDLVENPRSDTCLHLWKTLWDRDYAWLVESWEVGVEAYRRSVNQSRTFDKRFYFEFGQTYINYLIAGKNTMQRCLVGLHGNIYDITDFLEEHPGSPETLLVHAGQDATPTFESIGHSSTARRLTQPFCVVIDCSFSNSGCGARPGGGDSAGMAPDRRRRPRRPATLISVKERLDNEERSARRLYERRIPDNVLGELVIYYDAFDTRWKAWYTDDEFHETRFLSF